LGDEESTAESFSVVQKGKRTAIEYLTFIIFISESDTNAIYFEESTWAIWKMMGLL